MSEKKPTIQQRRDFMFAAIPDLKEIHDHIIWAMIELDKREGTTQAEKNAINSVCRQWNSLVDEWAVYVSVSPKEKVAALRKKPDPPRL